MDFLKFLVSRLGMFSILYRKLKQVYKCQLLQYTILILRIFTQRTLCTPAITFHKLALRLFTAIKLKEVSICCLKGQHPLTKIQDMKVCTLSFLQLFLELPETFWRLRKVLYPEKSPKITKHRSTPPHLVIFLRDISRLHIYTGISGLKIAEEYRSLNYKTVKSQNQ